MKEEQMKLVDEMWGDPSESIIVPMELDACLLKGRMKVLDHGLYVMLHRFADIRTGVCTVSVPFLLNRFAPDPDVSEASAHRAAHRSLERLRKNGFIGFANATRQPFPILIHMYLVRVGVHRGKLLDAFAQGTIESPVYVDEAHMLSRTLGEPAVP